MMTMFLLALAAGLIMGVGARDHALLAVLVTQQGRRADLLLTALACGLATVWLACSTAGAVGQTVSAHGAQLLAAGVLGTGAIDLLRARPVRVPLEPTRSLGALALVLLAWQIMGASRLALAAIALLSRAPWPVGLGAVAASTTLSLCAWAAGPRWLAWRFDRFGRAIGLAVVLIAFWLARI